MAKLTVLDIVQTALIHIGSDSVNSISDTQEAQDVARIVRDAYLDIIDEGGQWGHLRVMTTLTSVSDTSKPTHLKLDDTLQYIDNETLYYDKRALAADNPLWARVSWLHADAFLEIVLSRGSNLDASNVQEVVDVAKFYVMNDSAPTYATSFDDEFIIFDSFNNAVDTTLQGAKSQVMAFKEPSFSISDTFIPDLPSKNFPHLVSEVKARTAASIAQEIDAREERTVQRHRHKHTINRWRTKNGIRQPNYGRTGKSSSRSRWRERNT